jgi:hypothetical protein
LRAAPPGKPARRKEHPDGMGERQTYLWRILVTGTCFVLFGIGGLILGLLVFPALLLWPGDRAVAAPARAPSCSDRSGCSSP